MNDANHHQTIPRPQARPVHADGEDLLGGLRGKGPREVLSAIVPSGLGWAMLQATIGCLVVMAVLTVGPYLWSKNATADEKKAGVKEAEQKEAPDPAKVAPKPVAETKTTDSKTTTDSKKDQSQPSKDIVNKLKENDVKKDKPKDPFGTNIDDLIDKK